MSKFRNEVKELAVNKIKPFVIETDREGKYPDKAIEMM